MTLLGIGLGMAMNPVLLAAMSDVAPVIRRASGVVNTALMGGRSARGPRQPRRRAHRDKLLASERIRSPR